MIYVVGIVVLAIIVWVLFLRSAGTASGQAIVEELKVASEKVSATLNELIREVPKLAPERLSEGQFHRLVERVADDFSRYAQIAYVVSSKLNQGAGQAMTPHAAFLAEATAELAAAIGASIQSRDAGPLTVVMRKYGIKSTSQEAA